MVLEDCFDTLSLNNSNLSSAELWSSLQEEERVRALYKIPTAIFLAVVFTMGIFGNILVVAVYAWRYPSSTTKTFILGMAFFDFCNCLNGVPLCSLSLSADFRLYWRFECSVLRFFASLFSLGSVVVLMAVAVDRFRRICKPLKRQISVRMSKIIVGLLFALALLSAWPFFFLYISKPTQLGDWAIHSCTTDKDNKLNKLYHMYLALIVWAAIISFAVLYTFIILAIRRQKKKRRTMSMRSGFEQKRDNKESSSKDTEMSDYSSPPGSQNEAGKEIPGNPQTKGRQAISITAHVQVHTASTDKHGEAIFDSPVPIKPEGSSSSSLTPSSAIKKKPESYQHISHDNSSSGSLDTSKKPAVKKIRKQGKTRREITPAKLTLMMFYVTVGFIVSYVPYIAVRLHETLAKDNFDRLYCTPAYSVFFIWSLRSVYLNNGINPIIYGYCNVIFRRDCVELGRTIMRWFLSKLGR